MHAAVTTSAATGLPPTVRFLERDWLSSNNVLLVDDERAALVDSGYSTHSALTLALVQHALQGRRLDLLANTHLHSDHCGGNALLQRHYACRTMIPAAGAAAVREWNPAQLSFADTAQRCERFSFDDVLQPDQALTLGGLEWQTIASPGHDPDSLMLHCPDEALLISADALWEDGFGVIFPELEGQSGFAEQRAVLERISALDVRCVLPGHGSMFSDVGGALERAFARLDRLAADPERNARHAIKVLLKFMLLEHQSLPLRDLPSILESTPLTRRANERFLRWSPEQLAEWSVAELIRAGAARIREGRLLNS